MSVTVATLRPPLPHPDSADGRVLVALEAATQQRPLPLATVLEEALLGAGHAGGGRDVSGTVVLARDGSGTVVGMASARREVDVVHVIRIAVVATQRRGGVGRLLLDALVAWASEQPAGAVLLEVRAGNVAAQGLYAAAGFLQEGRRRAYYPDGEDALLWRLPLTVTSGSA